MKHLIYYLFIAFPALSVAQKPETSCCSVIQNNNGMVLMRNNNTGKTFQFKANTGDINNFNIGDSVSFDAGLSKITAVNGAAKTYSAARVIPAPSCCSIVSISPDPERPCCNIIKESNKTTLEDFSFSADKKISGLLKPGQAVYAVEGYAMVQTPSGFYSYPMKPFEFDYSVFGGKWESTWGPVELNITKETVSGKWDQGEASNGQITGGSFDERTKKLHFTYTQDWNNKTGKADLVFSETAREYILSGLWGHDGGSGVDGVWTMKKNRLIISDTTAQGCITASIKGQPGNQTAEAGKTATFSVSANGTAPIQYVWYKNDQLIPDASGPIYTTPTLTVADDGNGYKCIMTNCKGLALSNTATLPAISNTATLTVTCTAVSIVTQPESKTANIGSHAEFSVFANGTAPFLYSWYKNNLPIYSTGLFHATYLTPELTDADNGNTYKCVVTNCDGTHQATSNTATLTVTCTAVSIGTQPQNHTATAGNTATFSVSANGTGPFSYIWYKNNQQIGSAHSPSYTTPTLTAADNGNTYKCEVFNHCYNEQHHVTSNTVTLIVPCTAVSIATQPQNQIATPGKTATFSVSANGTGPFLYSWYTNGQPIPGSSGSNPSYTTPVLTAADNLNGYKCVVTNCDGTHQATSNTATLTIRPN